MRVLGIDCGSHRTGYGVIDSDGLAHHMVAAGVILTDRKSPFEQRLLAIAGGLRRLIRVRKKYPVFGRGSLKFVACENRRVVAYLREYQGQKVLVVNNLSGFAQPAELDLRSCQGEIPVELLGNHPFPMIGDKPYLVTLSPHSFFWFRVEKSTP